MSTANTPTETPADIRPGTAIRDPLADHLIIPQNSALILIDYQPDQVKAVRSMDQDLLVENIISTVKLAKLFGVPVVHSTVNVASGRQEPTIPRIAELLEDDPPVDRTSLNAWEDVDFLAAVRATGRRKLIACALWTEICMAFPSLDALREGYEVYPVVDAIAARPSRPIGPALSVSLRLEASPSAGSRWRASFSAIGPAKRPWPESSRSCSPSAC